MKDMVNLNNSKNKTNVSKDKIDILIREIKAKGEKIINIYNSFSQEYSCGYSLTQLYKLTDENIKYKDDEYRFYTNMIKNSIFNWKNHEKIINLSENIINTKLFTVYYKYMKFKNNKLFANLKDDIAIEDLNLAINKLSALLNNSFALLPPIYSNAYTNDFIDSDIYNRNLSKEELRNEAKRINYTHNGHIITKYTTNNISYWIKGLIYRDKKNEAFNKYYRLEDEIYKQYKENIDCLNIYVKSFKFLKPILIESEYNSIKKYILNEDEFGLYLKELCNKVKKYRNYLSIIKKVNELDSEVKFLLEFIHSNTKSINEGEKLLQFINKYYYYLLINNLEKSNQYINDYISVEDYFNILTRAIEFTNKILNTDSNIDSYLDELFKAEETIKPLEKENSYINYENEIISLLKSWGYKIITNYRYKNHVIKYVVCTKDNINNFVPIYFDSINNFNVDNLKEILSLLSYHNDILFIWSRDWWYKRNSETIRIRSFLNRIL